MKYSLVTCFLPGGLSGRRAPAGVGGERYRTANPVSMPKKTRKYPPNASQEEWKPKLCPPPNVGSDFQPLTNVVPPSLCLGRAQGFLAQPESYRCKVLSGGGPENPAFDPSSTQILQSFPYRAQLFGRFPRDTSKIQEGCSALRQG